MKILNNIQKAVLLLAVIAAGFTSCNKLDLDPVPTPPATQAASPTLASLLDDPNYSFLKTAVVRAGLAAGTGATILQKLNNPDLRFTVFAPDNAAFIASGIPSEAVVNSLPIGQVFAIVSYHVIPQLIASSSIATSFPNFQYPTTFNPNPAASALLRLTTFPSVRANGAWVNNVPITAVNIPAVNGLVHKVARIVLPPSSDLWSRIDTSSDLTYLKAAIQRADSGVAPGGRLLDALSLAANPSSIASNLTIFAPNDVAMQQFLTGAITQALIARGLPPATAQFAATTLVTNFGTLLLSNPASIPDLPGFPPGIGNALASVITPTLAKGIVAYHIISSQVGPFTPPGVRVFSVNLPSTATPVKTLLNSAVAIHPGVQVQATFVSPFPGISVVIAATVKGAANTTASNVIIGSTSSDLHHVNGVIHKIDQVLRPQ